MAKPYFDQDSDTSFLDKPIVPYSDGTMPITGEELDNHLDPEWRKAHGLGPILDVPTLDPDR